jgi:hypothetical protein
VEAFEDERDLSSGGGRPLRLFKPSVVYSYEVNGRGYRGDRVVLGMKVSASVPVSAKQLAAKYPVGSAVDVYYDPDSPGDAVLNPHSRSFLFPWFIAAVVLAFTWAVATGRLRG